MLYKNSYSNNIILILSILILCFSSNVFSDEAVLEEAGGCMKLIDGEHMEIALVSEVVIIELEAETYTIDATFEFFNSGNKAVITVGFPYWGIGYNFKGLEDIKNFEIWVNDERFEFIKVQGEFKGTIIDNRDNKVRLIDTVKTSDVNKIRELKETFRKDIRSNTIWAEEWQWFVKKVTFPANEKTVTRVRFTAKYANMMESRFLEYLYGIGNTWNGNIGSAKFIIRTTPTTTLQEIPHFGEVIPRFGENNTFSVTRNYIFNRVSELDFEFTMFDFKPINDEVLHLIVNYENQPFETSG